MNLTGSSALYRYLRRLTNGHHGPDAGGDGGGGDTATTTSGDSAATDSDADQQANAGVVTVGGAADDGADQVQIPPGTNVGISVPEAQVDPEKIEAGLTDVAAERAVLVQGQANDDDSMTVNPIAESDSRRLGGHFSSLYNEFDRIDDDKIQKLRDNQVEYNERVGKWILVEDDRVPAVLNNQVGLILGQAGLEVEPEDPDSDADEHTAEHLRDLYSGDLDDEPHVDPADVVRSIMAQNYLSARSVVRATDLADLPLDSLTYYRDPEDSTEYYVQDSITYKKLIPDDSPDENTEGKDWSVERRTTDEQLLVLGEHVFDAHLFRSVPLRSIADLVVNKMVLQRLMARKAEIASVGGLYIKVSPPDWLQESAYHDQVEDPEDAGETISKLELHMREGVNDAFSTLEDYQSGFIMSIPSHWEVQQIEVPETGEPMADQIRAYNKSIAARLLFPLDLMELREGTELSRDTLFRTLLNTIAGWRSEILNVFDDFARIQKDIHGLSGSVTHSLPALETEDEKLLIQALKHAGVAGMTVKEIRQTLNRIEGYDLDEQPEGEPVQQGPPPGGPGQPDDRSRSMRDMLDLDDDADQDSGQDQDQESVAAEQTPSLLTDVDGVDAGDVLGMAQNIPGVDDPETGFRRLPKGWDRSTVLEVWSKVGGSFTSCKTKFVSTEGWSPRKANRFCAALKDEVLGTEEWREGGGEASVRPFDVPDDVAEQPTTNLVAALQADADPDTDATHGDD